MISYAKIDNQFNVRKINSPMTQLVNGKSPYKDINTSNSPVFCCQVQYLTKEPMCIKESTVVENLCKFIM